MTLDTLTISLMTALVMTVSGVLYLLESILRKDNGAGRAWSIAFLAGILTVLSYFAVLLTPDPFVAVAVGNAAFVTGTGFIWLGCLSFNGARLRLAGIVIGVVAVVCLVWVLAAGPDASAWAGSEGVFAANALFGALGAIESRRGALGRRWNTIPLTMVLAVIAIFFVARLVGFVVWGPDSVEFQTWLGSNVAGILTITLTIVLLVTASVLRASEGSLRGDTDTIVLRATADGVMMPTSFESATGWLMHRAERSGETVCALAVRVDDVGRVATAFGPGEADALNRAWRTGVRTYAPTAAIVGEYGRATLVAVFLVTTFGDVRRTAGILQRRVLDDFGALGGSVIPVVGVGIATTEHCGYEVSALLGCADAAAVESRTSPDASVIVSDGA